MASSLPDRAAISVALEWRDITLTVQTDAGPKPILQGLSGNASPGELVAIMGPSGAGKTSLLNVLAQRTPESGGSVLLNGKPWQEQFLSILTYMPQDEKFLPELTPREHLTFMAQLRLHDIGDESARRERVERALCEMNLLSVADAVIGTDGADGALSRNERKRLNFAAESLTEPSLLYVDEPTTGLDSVMAKSVVEQLKRMAGGSAEHPAKRTVLATIHQPSEELFSLFDKLYFMVDGRCAFFGPTAEISTYFASIGYPLPAPETKGSTAIAERCNVASFVMELVVDPADRSGAAKRRKHICDVFAQSPGAALQTAAHGPASEAALARVEAVDPPPLHTQFSVLLRRDGVVRRRTPLLTRVIILRNTVLALLIGLVLLRLTMSQTYVYSITGTLFFGVASCVMPTAVGHVSTLPLLLPIVVREVRAGAYSAKAFYFAKFVGDIPVDALGCLIFATLYNFMTGMARDSATVWLKCYGIYLAASFVGNAVGQWAAIVAPTNMPFVGLILALLVVIPQFLFCGVLMLVDQIPLWWKWMSRVSVFRYFVELLMDAQWADYGEIPCDRTRMPDGQDVEICPFRSGAQVISFYSMDSSVPLCLGVIMVWWIMFKAFGLRVLLKKCAPPASAFGGAVAPDDATAEEMPAAEGDNALLRERTVGAHTIKVVGGNGMDDVAVAAEKLRRECIPMELSWHRLGLCVAASRNDSDMIAERTAAAKVTTPATTSQMVLRGASGVARPGELVAVMGPAGSGKSVFLRCLGRRQTVGVQHGSVAYNGAPWTPELARFVAFMGQEDTFIADVTVQEHLLFHASLRMDQDISSHKRDARVEEIISALGLSKVRDTLIGNIGGGISGGERRRLSYAAELLQDPSLLLLDEPTSGLDSSMAEMLVKTLRVAANSGTTVVCTIHQPSPEIVAQFDKLLLLSEGEVAYYGAADAAPKFFAQLGHPVPNGKFVVDHLMSTVTARGSAARKAAVNAAAHEAEAVPPPIVPEHVPQPSLAQGTSRYDSSLRDQLAALLRREVTVRKRSKVLTKAVYGRTFVVIFLLCTLYTQVEKNQQGVFSITSALSFIVINHVFTYAIGQAVTMPLVIPTLQRENASNMYGPIAWYLAKTIADLPFDLGTTTVLATSVYWAVGFTDSVLNWLYFVLILIIVAMYATGFGHLIGTIAHVKGKPQMAVPLAILLLFPMFLFSGLLINYNNCPSYLIWMQYLSLFYYSFSLVATNQWENFGDITCTEDDMKNLGGQPCAFADGLQVMRYFGISPGEKWTFLAVVLSFVFFFRSCCAFLLWRNLRTRAAPIDKATIVSFRQAVVVPSPVDAHV